MNLNKYQSFVSKFSVITFPNYLGQKLIGGVDTPLQVAKYIGWYTDSPRFYNLNLKLGNKLDENLKILYETNKSITGKRINIGGDHSMAIASVADSLRKYDNLKVIWIDAHPDINTRESSATQNYHGMPLSFLTGLDKYPEFDSHIARKLDLSNLVYIGIRDIDSIELEFINRYNIKYYTVRETTENKEQIIRELDYWIADSPIHISWDVDSLDPEVVDSTGTPVAGGLDLSTAQKLLNFLGRKNWVNMDLTEMNLNLGNPEKSLRNLKKITDCFVSGSMDKPRFHLSHILPKL